MNGSLFRPWGEIQWLMSKSPNHVWDIIGCISFEERCVGLISNREHYQYSNNSLFFDIYPKASDVSDDQEERLRSNRNTVNGLGIKTSDIKSIGLLEKISSFIEPLKAFIEVSTGNIILDISCFPKRYFFPILRILVESKRIKNLVITYTKPISYTNEELSGDPNEWEHLPTFLSQQYPEPHVEIAIIGVGFMPLGLPQLLTGSYQKAQVKLIFPNPPGPPNFQRNWEFVRRIQEQYPGLDLKNMHRVHAMNMSDAFDFLCGLTDFGCKSSILAPYGPKPVSAAMALFAIDNGTPVYYTQPNYYSPNYSFGIGEVNAYWVIHNNKNLYSCKL